ncbi:MAG: glycosyltransferase family 2 protein [Candidatus Methanomethylicaceae archaeon]
MKISIITPSLNYSAFIRAAVESVLAQDYEPVEHIVVDGGSTDGTLEVLREYPHLKVMVGKDKGIHDALNRGLRMSTGDIIGFLNADDMYEPDVFRKLARFFETNPEADAVACEADIQYLGCSDSARKKIQGSRVKNFRLADVTVHIPAFNRMFFRRRVFSRLGHFDSEYRIAWDREFLVRLCLSGLNVEYVPQTVYCYRVHARSLTLSPHGTYSKEANMENWRIAEKYLLVARKPEERFWLKLWHAKISSEMFLNARRGGDRGEMILAARRGFRVVAWWPIVLGWRAAKRLWLLGKKS